MALGEALTGIYTSPLLTDQIPEVWKVLTQHYSKQGYEIEQAITGHLT